MPEAIEALAREFEETYMLPQRQARTREKTARLLEAGMRLIAEHGFDGMKIADLADEADCLPATFYQRFRDKEAFLAILHLRVIQETQKALEREKFFEKLRDTSPDKALRRIVDRMTDTYSRSQTFIREIVHRASVDPDFMKPRAAFGDYLRRQATEALRPHFAEFAHPNPERAVGLFVDSCFGLLDNMVTYQSGPIAIDDPKLRKELCAMGLGYLGCAR